MLLQEEGVLLPQYKAFNKLFPLCSRSGWDFQQLRPAPAQVNGDRPQPNAPGEPAQHPTLQGPAQPELYGRAVLTSTIMWQS